MRNLARLHVIVLMLIVFVTQLSGDTETVRIKVMTYNILHGGDKINLHNGDWCNTPEEAAETFAQTVEVIRQSGADIVGLQETDSNTTRIADLLGWYGNDRTMTISRYPLIDPPDGEGIYLFVEVSPGKIVAIANDHLNSEFYGPDLARDGFIADEVLAIENKLRSQQNAVFIQKLQPLMFFGIPVFITGDFNTPSHLDWTAEVAAIRSDVKYQMAWPTTQQLESATFRDSYREIYTDPIKRLGLTWTAGYPQMPKNETHDRIDFVFTAGPSTTVASQIVGEANGPDVDIVVSPWPSDHRAVLSTFDVVPAAPPIFVAANSRKNAIGDALTVRFHAQGHAGERIFILPVGEEPGPAHPFVALNGIKDGSVNFATDNFTANAYEAVLVSESNDILSRSTFWAYPKGQPTLLSTMKKAYEIGESIPVSWKGSSGMKFDWIGIFKVNSSNRDVLLYEYTEASIEGSAIFSASSSNGSKYWPLPAGSYEIRFLLDDAYEASATLPIEIVVQ